jgi:hypothetical protein
LQADQHHAPSATCSILLIHPVKQSAVGILLAKKEEVEIHEAKKEEETGDCSTLHRDMLLILLLLTRALIRVKKRE